MFVEDLSIFFADFAVDASWTPSTGGAAQSGRVIVNAADTVVLDDMLIASATTFTYPLGQWPALDEGQVLVVGASSYRVRSCPLAIDDGKLMRAEVGKV